MKMSETAKLLYPIWVMTPFRVMRSSGSIIPKSPPAAAEGTTKIPASLKSYGGQIHAGCGSYADAYHKDDTGLG